ncbi:hypothetical protein GGX14DRAFT_524739 [Mycena pura]|uniref:SET domain-containing protein n=1 Tax=Mycena pura TaxID=153505 RepID=A0AAD6V600_9AGAR|nr:hypothetical protein GGX14DRAFT_524739 [Mycena pura]
MQPDKPDGVSAAVHLVETVFERVCDDFRTWKKDYASTLLTAAAAPEANPAPEGHESEPLPTATHVASHSLSSSSATTLEQLETYDYETGTTWLTPIHKTHVTVAFPPCPEYEYCTPTDRNIYHGDDPSDMPFIPFHDDPSFNLSQYLEHYDSFSWDTPPLDPDLEVVVVETARRLQTTHQMQSKHIDETAVLPLELLDRAGTRGMIYRSRRRDFPPWPPGLSTSEKALREHPAPPKPSADKLLAILVSETCTNLNCLVGFCSTHLDPTPMPLSTLPLIKNARMQSHVHTPCSAACFLHDSSADDDTDMLAQPSWPAHDIQLLRTILDFAPDTLPCELATICAKPCSEVFQRRKAIIPDGSWDGKRAQTVLKPPPKSFADYDTKTFTPGKPCRHEGPCDGTTKCACFLNKAHCESSCRCSRKCRRRWPGCACTFARAGASGLCRTERCRCFLAHRECDPELCLKCEAKGTAIVHDAHANLCQNADIQRRHWKATRVGRARWGLGLFMLEDAAVDDLIIEYVGELIFDPTTDSREPIAHHRGRNYLFELNATLSIDGTYAGNNARYINHDARHPNCRAKVRLVNGEHRIGMYAARRVRAGEEVLFNYGEHFFQGDSKDADADRSVTGSARRTAGA